jgi:hypothetical protein
MRWQRACRRHLCLVGRPLHQYDQPKFSGHHRVVIVIAGCSTYRTIMRRQCPKIHSTAQLAAIVLPLVKFINDAADPRTIFTDL